MDEADFSDLSYEQRKVILAAFEKRGEVSCPMCGQKDWIIDTGVYGLQGVNAHTFAFRPGGILFVVRICGQCAFAATHALQGILGGPEATARFFQSSGE